MIKANVFRKAYSIQSGSEHPLDLTKINPVPGYYTHAVTAKDTFMSGWGPALGYNAAWVVVLCHGGDQARRVMFNLKQDGCKYVSCYAPERLTYHPDRLYTVKFAELCAAWDKT